MAQNQAQSPKAKSSTWLSTGFHMRPTDGMNIMECAAYISGQEHSSYPLNVCPVLSEISRRIADHAQDEDRQSLWQYLLPLSCSRARDAVTCQRLFYAVDFVVRRLAPSILTQVRLVEEATLLQALQPIREPEQAETAQQLLRGLFVRAYIHSERVPVAHIFSQLQALAGTAAAILAPGSEAWEVLRALNRTFGRLESYSGDHMANLIFAHQRVLLENLLCIGPNLPLTPDVLAYRRARLEQLEARMACGQVGRRAGAPREQ
jgi:hypothetical protein